VNPTGATSTWRSRAVSRIRSRPAGAVPARARRVLVGLVLIVVALAACGRNGTSVGTGGNRDRYRLSLKPARDVELFDHHYEFTAILQVSTDGADFQPAPGRRIDLALVGVGSIIRTEPAGPSRAACITGQNGRCRFTVRSDAPEQSAVSAAFEQRTATVPVAPPTTPIAPPMTLQR
jgi:hypothetical protein